MTICLYLLAFIFNKSLCNIFFNSLFLSANTYQVYLYYSSLENPMDGGAWQATVHGIARVGHNLVTKPPPPPPSICYMQDAVFYIILGFVLKKPKGSPEKSGWGGEEAICPEPDSVQSLSCVRLLWSHELQHTRPPCPSPTPGVYSNSFPLSWWCHPTISSSVVPFCPCPRSFPASGSFPMSSSHQVARVLEFQLQHQSFQWTPRTDLLQDVLVGSPCSPRDSQEPSPTPQFKSINFFVLSFLHGPTLTSIHDHWKNHNLDQMDLRLL